MAFFLILMVNIISLFLQFGELVFYSFFFPYFFFFIVIFLSIHPLFMWIPVLLPPPPPHPRLNPFAPGDFAKKRVLKLVKWFSRHCHAIKS